MYQTTIHSNKSWTDILLPPDLASHLHQTGGFWHRLLEIRRERHALEELDAHLLADIGLSREQAEKEAHVSLWADIRRVMKE